MNVHPVMSLTAPSDEHPSADNFELYSSGRTDESLVLVGKGKMDPIQ